MPNFKSKTTKKIVLDEKSNITLDNKHKEKEEYFKNVKENVLPSLRIKRKQINKIILNKKNIDICELNELKDQIKIINSEIKNYKNEEKNYYLNNNKFIFEYFEAKKEISKDNKKTTLLNSFFKIDDSSKNKIIDDNNVQKYLYNIDETLIDINNYIYNNDICKYCNKGEMIPLDQEGILVCNYCSKQTPFLIENEKPSYKEPPKEACFYAYKRINHFREILAQFQAKETTQIPSEVLENIKNQIKKERVPIEQLTNKKTKEILKRLGYNKYYEHIPFIKDKLGIKPPVMTPELEELLCNLFMEIQGPYAKYCPDDRVNFLNYYYTVYKLCELLDQKQFLPYFPMLKDREKRVEQDNIWKKICEELNWEFIPTL